MLLILKFFKIRHRFVPVKIVAWSKCVRIYRTWIIGRLHGPRTTSSPDSLMSARQELFCLFCSDYLLSIKQIPILMAPTVTYPETESHADRLFSFHIHCDVPPNRPGNHKLTCALIVFDMNCLRMVRSRFQRVFRWQRPKIRSLRFLPLRQTGHMQAYLLKTLNTKRPG